MKPETEKAMEALAAKLGTTVEKIWSVLLKQAPINATTNLIMCILLLVVVCCLAVAVRKVTKPGGIWHGMDESSFAWFTLVAMSLIVAFLTLVFSAQNIVAGYINPEFWALKEITKAIK